MQTSTRFHPKLNLINAFSVVMFVADTHSATIFEHQGDRKALAEIFLDEDDAPQVLVNYANHFTLEQIEAISAYARSLDPRTVHVCTDAPRSAQPPVDLESLFANGAAEVGILGRSFRLGVNGVMSEVIPG